jgi:vancomycin resistance protein YoaR
MAATKVVMPQYTAENLRDNTVLVGDYKTSVGEDAGRKNNLDRMCVLLNGLSIEPGQTLSLIGVADGFGNGFVEASVEEDGTAEGRAQGGGASQFAGTFYNAALKADMEIVERSKNLWTPDYLPVGQDAGLDAEHDLKVLNRSNYPVYVGAWIESDILTVELYGQLPEYDIIIESREISFTPAPHAEVVYTGEYPEGEQHTQFVSRPGYEVEIYRHYLEEGRTVSSEQISHDLYEEMRGVILQGISDG